MMMVMMTNHHHNNNKTTNRYRNITTKVGICVRVCVRALVVGVAVALRGFCCLGWCSWDHSVVFDIDPYVVSMCVMWKEGTKDRMRSSQSHDGEWFDKNHFAAIVCGTTLLIAHTVLDFLRARNDTTENHCFVVPNMNGRAGGDALAKHYD